MASTSDTRSALASGLPSGSLILDAHVHLYDPKKTNYPWMTEVPSLNRRHVPLEYWADASGLGIDSAIWVEVNAAPGENVKEAELVASWAADDRRLVGMVGSAPLDQGDTAAAIIDDLLTLGPVIGLRTLIETHFEEPGWALSEPFLSTLSSTCGPNGPAFDLCIRACQLGEVATLAERCPNTRFVLDHCGKPEIGGPDEARWRDDIAALALNENVFCKLSGLATEVVHGDATPDRIGPFLTHALNVFGPDRSMFASDWPICTLKMSLEDWVACVAPYGDDAIDSVFRKTALRAYRPPQRTEASV